MRWGLLLNVASPIFEWMTAHPNDRKKGGGLPVWDVRRRIIGDCYDYLD